MFNAKVLNSSPFNSIDNLPIYEGSSNLSVLKQLSADTDPGIVFNADLYAEVARSILFNTDYVGPTYDGDCQLSRVLDFSVAGGITPPEYVGQGDSFVFHFFNSNVDYVLPTYEANCLLSKPLALDSSVQWIGPVYVIEVVQREIFKKGSAIHQVFVI